MLTERTGLDAYLRFDRGPRRVHWEVTRACDLAGRHCRAVAAPDPYSAELTERDGLALIDQLAGFGAPLPHLVLTGGDPLKRPDLFALIAARGAVASASPWHRAPCRS